MNERICEGLVACLKRQGENSWKGSLFDIKSGACLFVFIPISLRIAKFLLLLIFIFRF